MIINPTRILIRLSLAAVLVFSSATAAQETDSSTEPSSTKPSATVSDQHVIVAVGAPGTEEYAEQFAAWAEQWKTAAAHTNLTVVGLEAPAENTDDSDSVDKKRLQTALAQIAESPASAEVWIVLIGHGTFDGKRAKFNLRGKDLQATELAEWLKPLKQNVVLINCSSSSSPFINTISGRNRIVISSTRSGFEYNYSRFGRFMASAINDLANDLDKDGQTSVLEAFCSASQSVGAVYQQDGRLATEHALIDDNGDGRGTPADWFEGTRAVKKPKEGLADGLAANSLCLERHGVDAKFTSEQRTRRYELEAQLERLRGSKPKMDEISYLARIEPILIELSQLYETAEGTSDE